MKLKVNNFDFESAVFNPDAFVSLGAGHNGRLHSMLRSDNSLQLVGLVAVDVATGWT